MSLTLWYHPLSSFCWKALIALYEGDVAFEPRLVNLGDQADRAAFQAVWPLARFPVLVDDAAGETIPESSIIVEYLAERFPAARALLPEASAERRRVRLLDRLFDTAVHAPFQWLVAERMRPSEHHDPFGVEKLRSDIRRGYDAVAPMVGEPWALGETFTLADCAALPALFYADYAIKLADWPTLAAYLERLKARPSVARVLAEAEPWFQYFPLKDG